MNYLLKDAPAIQLIEIEQPNFFSGLVIILVGISILYVIINVIFINKKKKGEKNNEETN